MVVLVRGEELACEFQISRSKRMQLKNVLVIGTLSVHMAVKDPVTDKMWRVNLHSGPFISADSPSLWLPLCPCQGGALLVSVWSNQKPQSSPVA